MFEEKKIARDDVLRISLESVEGMDPALLVQESEFVKREKKRAIEIQLFEMPKTIQGKGIHDRAFDPNRP